MSLLRDFIALLGIGLFLAGLYQCYAPAAYIAGGVALACFAFVWSVATGRQQG